MRHCGIDKWNYHFMCVHETGPNTGVEKRLKEVRGSNLHTGSRSLPGEGIQ